MAIRTATAHQLIFGREVPGAERRAEGWHLRWQGCAVMGILNITPDSFSDGGSHLDPGAAVQAARRMRDAGALMVDVGAESTRPGAEPVEAAQELDRLRPVLRALAGEGLVLSVDTLKAEVAHEALKLGAHLINDVTGLRDPAMREVCARAGAPAVIMHMQGEPRTMQQRPVYSDVVGEVTAFLQAQAQTALADGVPSVLMDPGLGFGKTLDQNLALVRATAQLVDAGHPLLIGASRKRMIGTLANVAEASERDAGSLALHLYAAQHGAALVRVHAVELHLQALRVQAALAGEGATG